MPHCLASHGDHNFDANHGGGPALDAALYNGPNQMVDKDSFDWFAGERIVGWDDQRTYMERET